ncbi:MAG: hydroxymethylglutaryl-CoA lyase [Actinobacteria bacterium]|nr:hydroxymethylglutaryl-CoA lyase [Actinomycetota bacterium]
MSLRFPDRVTLVEVGPRDGLQSLERQYPTEIKARMIDILAQAGLEKIEVTGFVRPDKIPQLADAAALFAAIEKRPGVVYRALCPNRRGAERAVEAGVDEILGLITASETYNLKNSDMTVEQNLVQAGQMAEVAREAGLPIVMAIGVCMFCPYEGELPESRVVEMIERMTADGIEEFYLATSVGLDGPRKVHRTFSLIRDRWPDLPLGIHLHNTNGMALANALAAMDAGVTRFEGSICGIGGGIRMPYGMAHYGNVATDDLAHMFSEMGIETGVSLDALIEAGREIRELLELETTFSYAQNGGTKRAVLEQGRTAPRPR